MTQDGPASARFGLCRVHVRQTADRILLDDAGVLGCGGNSGFQAINLALQFGAARLVLVGFDMTARRGGHWHPPHPAGQNPGNDALARWARLIDAAAPLMASLGVEVLNTSSFSALKAFPKVDFMDAIQ